MPNTLIGTIFKYDPNNGIAYLELWDNLAVGQTVCFKSGVGDYVVTVENMLVADVEVKQAYHGDLVCLKVDHELHNHDLVFKLV